MSETAISKAAARQPMDEFEAEYGLRAKVMTDRHWEEFEAGQRGKSPSGERPADIERRHAIERQGLVEKIDTERWEQPTGKQLEQAMNHAAGNYARLVNSGASAAEIDQAATRSSEAYRAFAEIGQQGKTAMSDGQRTFGSSDLKAAEVRIEARMAAGIGDVPHALSATERAAAMQEARQQAFNSKYAASPGYDDRRYPRTTTPGSRLDL